MELSKFLQGVKCEKRASYDALQASESIYLTLANGVDTFCKMYCEGKSLEQILFVLKSYLDVPCEEVYSGQREVALLDNLYLFERFYNYLQGTGMIPVKPLLYVSLPWDVPDGSGCLSTKAHMLCRNSEGKYFAFIIHPGSCSRSVKGKSSKTTAACDLASLICKLQLDVEKDVTICTTYLSLKKDKPGRMEKQFVVSDTANTNIHVLDYKDYYDDCGVLDREGLLNLVRVSYEDYLEADTNCFGCAYATRCHMETLSLERKEVVSETNGSPDEEYVLPTFTESQKEVIAHKDGAMRVCAGPGSGKTATLVGRIKHLICEEHVYGDFILVLSFANEAAKELKKRCSTFLSEEQMPCISTINGMCYQILKANEDLLGKELKVLSKTEKQRIVRNLLSVFPPLTGFSYQLQTGPNGLFNTVINRLDEFETTEKQAFYFKHPDLGADFEQFYHMYKNIVASHDYVTFDEQITMCNELFKSYPEVLTVYESIYQYVMVDEFQDVNAAQMEFLQLLCQRRGNLVVVGDDDQGIYGFRGATSDYMLHFEDMFPAAKTVVLKENFRSTKELVASAQNLIKNNKSRIAKDIVAGGDLDGTKPVLVHGKENAQIIEVIEALVKEGYRYEDIAILSTKNAPLELLHNTLSFPTVLAKSYLRSDPFVEFLRCVLHLAQDETDVGYLYRFCSLHGASTEAITALKKQLNLASPINTPVMTGGVLGELEDVIELLADSVLTCKTIVEPSVLIDSFSSVMTLKSNVVEVLSGEIEKLAIKTKDDFMVYLDNLEEFLDETRVTVFRDGRIALVTSHDSKGCEYPVVLLLNDYGKSSEEVRRLFYVAMTRAKERLFIFQDAQIKVDFMNEIPHTEWRREVAV